MAFASLSTSISMPTVLFSQHLNWIEESSHLIFSIDERQQLLDAFESSLATQEIHLPYTYICYIICKRLELPQVHALSNLLLAKSKPGDQ